MKRIILAAFSAAFLLSACARIDESISETDALPAGGVLSEASGDLKEAVPEETIITEAVEPETQTQAQAQVQSQTQAQSQTAAQTAAPVQEESTAQMPAAEDVRISLTFYEKTLYIGDSAMPIVTVLQENTPDKSEIWTSSDDSVAAVDGLGNITAAGEGECTVTVTLAAFPDISASVSVYVKAPVTEPTYINGILVANKSYPLPRDYNPGADEDALAAFDRMQAAAAEEGLSLYISSGFRSYDYQAGLYSRYVERSGKAEADRYSARPGHSEHQTGLAFDLNTIDISFADTEEYAWLSQHASEYGFIIRYPEGKEEITGYMYEPWHIRYLGEETAQAVTASGLTLEEYLGIDSVYADQ